MDHPGELRSANDGIVYTNGSVSIIEPSESSVAGVTLTMPDGWTTQDGLPTAIKHSNQGEEVFFYFITVDTISSEPCLRRDGMAVGPSVDDLAQALLDLPHTSAHWAG